MQSLLWLEVPGFFTSNFGVAAYNSSIIADTVCKGKGDYDGP